MKQADLQTNTVVKWITKEEAAKLLDKSVRTVLAMAAVGKIQSKLERDPERGVQKVTLFHAGVRTPRFHVVFQPRRALLNRLRTFPRSQYRRRFLQAPQSET